MRKFKKFDFWISVVLLVAGAIFIFSENKVDTITYLLVCFAWGIWHVLSMVVHLFCFNNWKYKVIRLAYTFLSAMVITYAFTIDFVDTNYIYGLPFMAIFYTALCGVEVYYKPNIENETI